MGRNLRSFREASRFLEQLVERIAPQIDPVAIFRSVNVCKQRQDFDTPLLRHLWQQVGPGINDDANHNYLLCAAESSPIRIVRPSNALDSLQTYALCPINAKKQL